ncbi:MAG TPA: FAD-dependent monooxygenase [Ramlibacter sp.]|uniref:FAD-dependent monooxygenase n=1 Tax=Ramlibacter sp. TaxID=1917967 RepID=UPI002B564D77|nr:FAD-dependent monooxygenase [Ramlibacter sp.]HVZ43551.1 FAD-dependent monooxygenase [Ramlibacter sp.]
MAERAPHVLVAGAGLGGLAAGLALLRRGIDVDIYEQAPSLGEVGAGVQISANGTRVLFELGLEAPVRTHGVNTPDKEIRLWNDGRTWSLFRREGTGSTDRYGYPMFMLHRKDLHAMLVEAVRGRKPDAIHLGCKATGFEQHADGVTLSFESGERATGDILVGADGLHSVVRRQLFGAGSAQFTGQLAWRGLAPIERLSAQQRRLVGTNWIGPKAHVTCYPVQRGELFNFVGQVDRDDWRVESWVTQGSVQECLADFPGWHAEVQQMIASCDRLYKWALFLREPLARWTQGRVALMGDACHAMLPYLGQGANSAMEDALVLARCIERWPSQPQEALRRYEGARVERTTRIVHESAAMARTFHNEQLADNDSAVRYIEAQWSPQSVGERYDWIYGYDAVKAPL